LLATANVDAAGGGTSLAELLSLIESRLAADHRAIAKLWTVVGSTLGETLPAALEWRFDLAAMDASLAFYDSVSIPAIRPPMPSGLSGIRFVSDFRGVPAVDIASWSRRLNEGEAEILPQRS
jgi:hypothetical protein